MFFFFSALLFAFLYPKLLNDAFEHVQRLAYTSSLNGTHAIVIPSSVNLNIFAINFNNSVAVAA
jgi:hypothetical protein